MRKIILIEPDNNEWKKWKLKCKKATEKVIEKVKCKQAWNINRQLYKEQKYEFYFKKSNPFYGRCAYCEKKLGDFDDLDHYRPAKEVTKMNHKVIDRLGYYWLAYDWLNLLPCCKACNSKKKRNGETTGKGNRFPVAGSRAKKPGGEKKEHPLLLNPTIDNPDKHFEYDLEDSKICSKEKSKKAKVTIRILGFHKREGLHQDWAEAEKEAHRELAHCLMEGNTKKTEQKMMAFYRKVELGKEDYSFVMKKVCENYIPQKLLET